MPNNTGYTQLGALTPLTDNASTPNDITGGRIRRFADAAGARLEVAVLTDHIARVRLIPPGVTPARSWAVARTDWSEIEVATQADDSQWAFTTAAMRIEVNLSNGALTFRRLDGVPFMEPDDKQNLGYVAPLGPADIPDARLPAGSVRCHTWLAPEEHIFGAGMRTGPMDARGQRITFWNTDPPQPHGDATGAMYAAIPFWLGLRNGRAYGVFMECDGRGDLNVGASQPDVLSFGVASGVLTYYVFAGDSPTDVLAQYSEVTGRMPMPPRWALGYGQSRWSYASEAHLRAVAAEFRKRNIPCDHLWLDIDYMDGYRVFTWNPDRYPHPKALLDELGAQGFKVVTIIDPGVKADPTDLTFAEGLANDYFVRRADGSLFVGVVWPGESVFADYSREDVRAWWGERQQALLDAGVQGIWDDMNEPSLTDRLVPGAGVPHGTTMALDAIHRPDGPESETKLPHAAFHNAYGMQMARASYEGQAHLQPDRRPFVLSRAGYAGVQRYAALWTGDNCSQWEHLRLAARMCLTVGLSGTPFVGFDTGGFWGNATGELLVRFTQLGAVFPFFRNHSAMETPAQEPWAFGQPFETLCRQAIELRYQLLPYLYTLFAEAARTGAPITRPMLYSAPADNETLPLGDQFLLGDDLLVAPALEKGMLRRSVIFPRSSSARAWRDWRSGQRYTCGQRASVDAPLDTLPLFIREEAILPLGPVMQYIGELDEEPLTLLCSLGPLSDEEPATRASGDLYEDDGATPAYQQGAWRRTRFTAEWEDHRITFHAEQPTGAYTPPAHEVTIEFRLPFAGLMGDDAARPRIASGRLAGRDLPAEAFTSEMRRYETRLRVTLRQVSAPFTLDVRLTE